MGVYQFKQQSKTDSLSFIFLTFSLTTHIILNNPENDSPPNLTILPYLNGARLVESKGQVPNQKWALGPTRHRSAVDEHFIKRYREGGIIAVHDHRGRVADQRNVNSSRVQVNRRGVVVGGDHSDGLALLVLLL